MKELIRQIPILYPFLLIIYLILNVLSLCSNVFFKSLTQLQYAYLNSMAPNSWFLIVGGIGVFWLVAVLIIIEYQLRDELLKSLFNIQLQPTIIAAILFQLLWLISWHNDSVLLALIFLAVASNMMLKSLRIISQNKVLRKNSRLIKYPIGFLTGWLIFETIVTLFYYITASGIGMDGFVWTLVAIITLFIIAGLSSYYYAQYGNGAIMVSMILGTISIALNHQASAFAYANTIIRLSAWLISVGMIGLFGYLSYLKVQQNRKSK